MLLSWKRLGIYLGVATTAGALGGFAAGWRQIRGLPPISVSADAGVSLAVDAGVASRADCTFSIEDWQKVEVPVPGATRYIRTPAGATVPEPPQVITLLMPDVRLTSSADAVAALQAMGTAQAGSSARVEASTAKAPPWAEAGPVWLHGFKSGTNLIGGELGGSWGPFGVRLVVVGGTGEIYGGGAVVWRFP
jgi:hypothetical protein